MVNSEIDEADHARGRALGCRVEKALRSYRCQRLRYDQLSIAGEYLQAFDNYLKVTLTGSTYTRH